jgi:hypothetical protein
MATLEQHLLSLDEDDEDFEEPEELDPDWSHVDISDFGDFKLTTEPVDGVLLVEAKKEIRTVCQNARNLLNKRTNKQVTLSDISNYYLKAILPGFWSSSVFLI